MAVIDCFGTLGPQSYLTSATNTAALEAMMTRFGVDTTIVAATEAMKGSMKDGNAWLANEINGKSNLRGYCVVDPIRFDDSQEEMRKYLATDSFVGAVLHEGYAARPLNSANMVAIVKSLLRYGAPLVIDIGNDVRRISDLQEVALEFPTQRFIILHMARENWAMAIPLAARATNIHLEIGGIVADNGKLSEAVDTLGPHRIIFGSGMPLVNPAYTLGVVRDSNIANMDKEKILFRNAKKIFGLD
jgi:hypothetical protein